MAALPARGDGTPAAVPLVMVVGHVHMQGICGVGMAGVAYLLARRGWSVSGCDAHLNAWADWLRTYGVCVEQGHDPAHLTNVDCVLAAHERGLPVFRRGEVLAKLVSDARGIAVCGAHGKTTTSCFTARLLQELGAVPEWCIGGTTPRLGGVAGCGNSDLLVAEADESDGTLAQYAPAVTVLTGIDLDHLEHFDGETALTACFASVVARNAKVSRSAVTTREPTKWVPQPRCRCCVTVWRRMPICVRRMFASKRGASRLT